MISMLRPWQTVMTLDALKSMVNRLLADPDRDQDDTRQKLDSIIEKLSNKQAKLKERLLEFTETEQASDHYQELEREYQVVNKLLKKDRKS